MSNSIVLDITKVVDRQKKSKTYNIKLAILIVGILVFSSVTVAGLYNIPTFLFLGASLFVAVATVFIYNIPGSADKKFLKPYVDEMYSELNAQNYVFRGKNSNKNLNPWFSGSSGYLYGKGLTVAKDPSKGLTARKLEFQHAQKGVVFLSVERLSTQNVIFLQVVELDTNGEAVELELTENVIGTSAIIPVKLASKLPASAFRNVDPPVTKSGDSTVILPPSPQKL